MITLHFTIDGTTRELLSYRSKPSNPTGAETLMHRYLLEVFAAAMSHINARGGAVPAAGSQFTLMISGPPNPPAS